jgi:dethiobiotin synthetase
VGARGYFIAGTDTGVGKTRVTCALLQAFRASGKRAAGMKPVATGALRRHSGLISDDVEQIALNSTKINARSALNPYIFEPPVSPDIAAEIAGICIETNVIVAKYRQIAAEADVVLVEGTGGWLCPIGAATTMADVAVALGIPVLLVVGLRLGCISHALLTAESIRRRGCTLAGWIGNRVDPDYLLPDANLATLTRMLGAAPLALLDYRPAAASDPPPGLLELARRLQPES